MKYTHYSAWNHCLVNNTRKGYEKFTINGLHGVLALYTICPADNATAGSLGRRRAGQLRFGFVAVSAGRIVSWGVLDNGPL
jgi:hypothetical protein